MNAELVSVAEAAMEIATATLVRTEPGVRSMAKGPRDLVTTVDIAIENAVRGFLAEETPEIGFIGEETGESPAAGLRWVLDPIDGTVNFSRGLPTFAISLTLIDSASAVLALADSPRLRERYMATRGGGGSLNGSPLVASSPDSIGESLVCLDDFAPGGKFVAERAALYTALSPKVMRIRSTGSAALDLAWLAAGRVDAVIMMSNQPWDTAGGVLMAREAGAFVADLKGAPHEISSTSLLAASSNVAAGILNIINAVNQS